MTRSPGLGFIGGGGAGGGGGAASALFLSPTYYQSVTSTNHSFTGVDFGVADANRYILVSVGFRSGSNGGTIQSATIGGVAATIITQVPLAGGNSMGAGWIGALVPNGATGTVSMVHDVNATDVLIGVFSSTTIPGLTPIDSFSVYSSNTDPSGFLSIIENGFMLGMVSSAIATTNVWSGTTLVFETAGGTRNFSDAYRATTVGLPGQSISCAIASDGANNMSCFSLGPIP